MYRNDRGYMGLDCRYIGGKIVASMSKVGLRKLHVACAIQLLACIGERVSNSIVFSPRDNLLSPRVILQAENL
jgi:hypothetical protein